MLRFKEFNEQTEIELSEHEKFKFMLGHFDYFQDPVQQYGLTEDTDNVPTASSGGIRKALEAHARQHLEPQQKLDGKGNPLADASGKPIIENPDEHKSRMKKELADAISYFKNTDMRTSKELEEGRRNTEARNVAAQEFKTKNQAKSNKDSTKIDPTAVNAKGESVLKHKIRAYLDLLHPLVNGYKPIKFNAANPFSETSKMQAHLKDGAYVDKNGEEPTLTAFQMTPGESINDNGEKVIACPGATESCRGDRSNISSDHGTTPDAACLGIKGNNGKVGTRQAMRARLNAITNPTHQKHAAIAIAHALINQNQNANNSSTSDERIGRLHFRPNNTSDVAHLDGILKAVNDHADKTNIQKKAIAKPEELDDSRELKPKFKVHKIKRYAYTSQNLSNHKNTDWDYRVSSLKGPANSVRNKNTETQEEKEKNDANDVEREKNQDNVIHNLLYNGEYAAAYGLLNASRSTTNRANRGGETEEDPRRKVKVFVFHSKKHGIQKFAAHGNDIDTKYGKNVGDLRSDDRTADEITNEYGITGERKKELTHNQNGEKKGRITTTTVTGISDDDIQKSPFVYPVTHRTLDKRTGELHVDAPKEVGDEIFHNNIHHDISAGNHLSLIYAHNYFMNRGDHASAEKIRDALIKSGASLKYKAKTSKQGNRGDISHINDVSLKHFANARSHNINLVSSLASHKAYTDMVNAGYANSLPAENAKDNRDKALKIVNNKKMSLSKSNAKPTFDADSGKITHLNGMSVK